MQPKLLLALLAFLLFLAPLAELPVLTEARAAAASTGVSSGDNNDAPPFFSLKFERLKKTFLPRLGVNVLSMLILILGIYYPHYRKTDYFFSFFMFNVTIFFITYLLSQVDLSMGAAFGLFAVFSLLRFRTEDIAAKDMTYLYVSIALGLLSAANKGTILEMGIINGGILLTAFLFDGRVLFLPLETKNLQYDSIEKTKPEHYQELLKELRERTGLDIRKFTVGRIDYLRDTANIKIYYHGQPGAE
jgi:hypothetical protein